MVLFDLILEVLPFIERAQSSALDRGDVDEYIFAACLRLDKSVAFVGLNHFTVPRAISICQVTIRGDVILVGDLVAKAATELYTAVFQCLTRAVAACRCPGACARRHPSPVGSA